jgi:uncharacterized membrane protein AbrB (regulator of aidB expression)
MTPPTAPRVRPEPPQHKWLVYVSAVFALLALIDALIVDVTAVPLGFMAAGLALAFFVFRVRHSNWIVERAQYVPGGKHGPRNTP